MYPQNLRFIETELRLDNENFQKLKMHVLFLGGIIGNADFVDLEEDDSDDDVEVGCEYESRIVCWDEMVV